MNTGIISLILIFGYVQSKPYDNSARVTCGYESCPKLDPNKINVHLIPHSHDDVGWLKTVDQYYYGQNSSIQRAGVQYIIGSVVEALRENKDRRFIQVETAFFWQWWNHQSDETKRLFKSFVENGQIEMINGAWSMNDEAATNYQSIIDQFTWGLKILNNTLGECGKPRIGWQIDPFGHSSEMANIFTQMGYEAVFFARLDFRDKEKRMKSKDLELIWQGNTNIGSESNLFTHIFYNFYTTPNEFCWDVICDGDPIVDDESSPEYNVEERVDAFREFVENHAKSYKTKNVLIPMGQDFTFQAAEMYYMNIDKLIEGFKRFSKNITLFYSTPSCYLKAVNEEAQANNVKFELKTDDFFPYASDKHSYWSGYYTSRPNSKRLERMGNNILQATKQLISFQKVNGTDFSSNITLLREAIGTMQHHDAITGTEKQHVAQDYARIVTKAIKTAESNISNIIGNLLRKNSENIDKATVELSTCLLANVTHCPQSNADRFVVTAYNPLSRSVSHYIRLPVSATNFTIIGPNNKLVEFDLLPVIHDFVDVHNITTSKYELVFEAQNIPPFGLQYYYVTKEQGNVVIPDKASQSFGDEDLGFTVDTNGLLDSVTINKYKQSIKQELMYYKANNGTNKDPTQRASGAYVFRPNINVTDALPLYNTKVNVKSYKGKFVEEIHQTFNDWVKQIIRVYKNKNENNIEFDWLVGPIEVMDDLGVEVINRFISGIKSNDIFYTDSNGRQMMKRQRKPKETYAEGTAEPIAGNYYPVTSRIVIKDGETELAVLNERAQGGSSLKTGVVELMVHRHLLNDDAFGVGEALNETEFGRNVVARGRHFLTFSKISEGNAARIQRDISQRKLLEPWVLVGSATSEDHTLQKLQEKFNFEYAGLNISLPLNVQLLTLEPWEDNTLILRLEHTFAKDEDKELSQNATVDLKKLFHNFEIKSLKETTLSANRWIEDGRRQFTWNVATTENNENNNGIYSGEIKNSVILAPMQIRTFIITYGPRSDKGKGAGNALKPLSLTAALLLLLVHFLT